MKRAIKKKSGIYAYLNKTKVLEAGSDEDIARARQTYWKIYKAEWRKNRRKQVKKFVIDLSADEAKQIASAAKKHKRSSTRFIKDSCFAYLMKQYLAPDPLALATIHQLLAMNYNLVQKLFDENKVTFDEGRTVLSLMAALEQKIINELNHPKECKESTV